MNKTIYVRDENILVWDKAKELAGDKLSPVIMEGLKRYVAQKEGEKRGYERIEVLYRDCANKEMPTAKAFYGRWLFPRDKPLQYTFQRFAAAITAKGRYVVLDWEEYVGNPHKFSFHLYESSAELIASGFPAKVAADIIEKAGVQIEELDI